MTRNAPNAPSQARQLRPRAPRELAGLAFLALVLAIAPFTGLVYPYFIMQALCFALFASAFNLLVGYGGLLSFGHAMFLATGGYVTAHMAVSGDLAWLGVRLALGPQSPGVAIVCGVVAAALAGAIVGAIAIRRQGIYFAMTTLALAQMTYFFFLQAPFTHGEDGIQGVPQGRLFGVIDLSAPLALYFVVLALTLGALLLIYRVINSPFGETLKAIRENEPRAISLGYRTNRYKLAVFTLSAALAGLAGAAKVVVAQNASLADAHWSMSGEVVLMTLVGGLGTYFGPLVGAFAVVAMQQYLASYGQWVAVIQGLVFVSCVLAFRRGIVGEIAAAFKMSL